MLGSYLKTTYKVRCAIYGDLCIRVMYMFVVIPRRLSSKHPSRMHSKYTNNFWNTQIKFNNQPLNIR